MPVVERMRPLLGTFVTIRAEGVADAELSRVQAAVEAAFLAISRVDALMSFHRPASDISRLNRTRKGARVRVHGWTYRVLYEALRLWHWSGGSFDCNVGALLMRSGLLPMTVARRARYRPFGHAVSLLGGRSVRLNAPVTLDLGGIAKGFAVDQAVESLQAHGMQSGSVNAGGDLRVFGEASQPVWVRCPNDPARTRWLGALANGAIATSAAYFVDDAKAAQASSAIVDVAGERRVPIAGSVSVIAKNCMLADALTKIAVLDGRLPTYLASYAQARVVTL